jgi:two-component system phosphate regulon sensor histidine kinase PhoR
MRIDDRWPAAALAAAAAAAGMAAVGLMLGREADEPEPQPLPKAEDGPALTDVLDAVAEPVLLVEEFTVTLANRAATTVMGAQIVGQDVREAIPHPAAAERLSDLDVGEGEPIELKGLGPLNQRWQMRVAAIGHGRRLVHLIDHTESHAAERMRVDFVANASHELRTPLAAVRGFIETLEEAGDDVETRTRFLSIMGAEALRMQRLVEDLISLSRIEAEKYRLPSDAVDLSGLAAEVHAELVAAGDGRGRDVVLSLDPNVPRVVGDRAQLSQVVHNLVSNAMKYGRAGTPVQIALARAGPEVRIAISDQGEGIPAKHIPRLTQRFYRVDNGRSRAMGGTGLGLAIVKHIVERHRGRLQITSEVGVGTTVAVTLPALAA